MKKFCVGMLIFCKFGWGVYICCLCVGILLKVGENMKCVFGFWNWFGVLLLCLVCVGSMVSCLVVNIFCCGLNKDMVIVCNLFVICCWWQCWWYRLYCVFWWVCWQCLCCFLCRFVVWCMLVKLVCMIVMFFCLVFCICWICCI